ncbi:hypothetical protein BHM03_00010989 [Ensete ventricosum]|nr:hypothetical protein BHM03_00010989 [Ensete ventricosum]
MRRPVVGYTAKQSGARGPYIEQRVLNPTATIASRKRDGDIPVWIEPRRVGGDERRLRLVRGAKQSNIVGQKREHHRRAERRRDAVLHLRDGGALQERDEDGSQHSLVGLAVALPVTGLPARRTRRSAVAAVSALVSFAAGSDGSGGWDQRA